MAFCISPNSNFCPCKLSQKNELYFALHFVPCILENTSLHLVPFSQSCAVDCAMFKTTVSYILSTFLVFLMHEDNFCSSYSLGTILEVFQYMLIKEIFPTAISILHFPQCNNQLVSWRMWFILAQFFMDYKI